MIKAYIASAVAIAVVSTVALYVRFPFSELLLSEDFERARGLFKDANVYGPYLIPAALILAQESLQPRLLRLNRPTQVFCFGFLAAGILFSFSRGAWLNLVVGIVVMTFVVVHAPRRLQARVGVAVRRARGWRGSRSGPCTRPARSDSSRSGRSSRATTPTASARRRAGSSSRRRTRSASGPGSSSSSRRCRRTRRTCAPSPSRASWAASRCWASCSGTLILAARNAALGRDTYGIGSAPLLAAWCGMLANSFVVDTLHWRHLWLLAGLIWAGTHARGVRSQLSSRVGRAAVR